MASSSASNLSTIHPGTDRGESSRRNQSTRREARVSLESVDSLDGLEPRNAENDNRGAGGDDALFSDDPMSGSLSERISFKRKTKSQQNGLLASSRRLFSRSADPSPPEPSHPLSSLPASSPPAATTSTSPSHPQNNNNTTKEPSSDTWSAQGPRKRVGYGDFTTIDWIFEYTQERQRVRELETRKSIIPSNIRRLLDDSQVWIVLILCGVLIGVVAACLDVVSNWLGDVKMGYCSQKESGAFYLSRDFCCMGYDSGEDCAGWRTWSEVIRVGREGVGAWIVSYLFYVVMSVAFATTAAVLVREYALHAKHSGLPEIKAILSGLVIHGFFQPWTLITKSLGLCLAVASGMWLGKEGPLVHVACCIAQICLRPFRAVQANEARTREVFSAAAAAGISVVFGSPIGGVLFTVEQLTHYFPERTMWHGFVCAMTAAVALQAVDPFRSGKLVLYQVKYSVNWHDFEFVPYCILGALGGVYGGLFIRANMVFARWRKQQTDHSTDSSSSSSTVGKFFRVSGPVTQVFYVALLSAFVNFPNVFMRAETTNLLSDLVAECSPTLADPMGLCAEGASSWGAILGLVMAAVLGFGFSVVTFGLQIPAGIILPSMAIGALMGRAMGIFMEILVTTFPSFVAFSSCPPDGPCVTPGTYALVGAAAALAGVTRMTVSIVVIVFELTGALTYVLPLMVAVMISKWVGDAFSRRGIYDAWIQFYEYPFIDNTNEMDMPDVRAREIMTRIEDLVVLTAHGHTIASIRNILKYYQYQGFPIISDPREARLLGYIARSELVYSIDHATSIGMAAETPVLFAAPREDVDADGTMGPDASSSFLVVDAHQPSSSSSSSAAANLPPYGLTTGASSTPPPPPPLDLRPWVETTPLTLSSDCPLHFVVSYLQQLGLRYVLLTERGSLHGLLTKKDVWSVLNHRRPGGGGGGGGDPTFGAGLVSPTTPISPALHRHHAPRHAARRDPARGGDSAEVVGLLSDHDNVR